MNNTNASNPACFSFAVSGERRLAGCSDPLVSDFAHRRTRKRSLWHFQLILHPRVPPHPFILPSTLQPPRPISCNLSPDLTGTVCDVYVVTRRDSVGVWDDVFTVTDRNAPFPMWTTATSLAACIRDSYPQFTVCTVSTWCPCCLFVFLLHYIIIFTH